MLVAITGGTGFIGAALVRSLRAHAHTVRILTRDPQRAEQVFADLQPLQNPEVQLQSYDPQSVDSLQEAITHVDAIVNLAGETLAATRWTPTKKAAIRASRIDLTENLVAAIRANEKRPQVLISASAIGYYGSTPGSDRAPELTEDSPAGEDFLANICQDWEAAAFGATELGVRVVVPRIGIVLEKEGGALAQMLPLFQAFLGGAPGSGKQWFSWVHRDDVVGAILFALNQPSFQGAYNVTAPNPVQMARFCQVLGEVIARPSWLPVPSVGLQALFGESAQIVLEGQKVIPARIQAAGFNFTHTDVAAALQAILVPTT